MKYVFFGSFRIAADILNGIINAGYIPAAVVCSPDKLAGRKKILTAPPVKIIAGEHKIPVLQPDSLKNFTLNPIPYPLDFTLVMGYPKIIPKEIISLPRLGTIGVHPSLLPKYRGPSPIQTAILNGEEETGVTLYLIDEKVDHGQVLAKGKSQMANGETNAELEKKLAKVAAELVVKTLPDFLAGKIVPKEQDHATATFTKKFSSADGQVDFQKDDPRTVYRKIKAFYPEPSVWTMNFPGSEGKRVKLLEASWSDNKIHITAIQVDGKKPTRIL